LFQHSQAVRDSSVALLLALLVLAATLLAAGYAHAQAPSPLLAPASVADNARYARSIVAPDVGVVRQRPVALDLANLDERQKAASTIVVDLFDGRSLTLSRDHVERRADANYTWHGKLRGAPQGFAVITVVDGFVSGTIEPGDGGRVRYQIQSGSDGIPLLREIDAAAFPDDHPSADALAAPVPSSSKLRVGADGQAQTTSADGAIVKADSAATIDVMIVFSNQSAAAAGAALGAQAQQAVDTANLVYANSGITTRLRLVYAGPANYAESGDFNTDLSRLTTGGDGFMDNVTAMRDLYGADLVSLFVENGQYCGLGWIGPNANYGFTVVNRGCASGNLSYPHELGHNFGARHDTYVDAATTPYAYGHGWVDIGQGWRDVMAYNNACAAYGRNCTRIAYLSNPNVFYGNPPDPTGSSSTADTARVHNQNALTVANFRASKQGGTTGCTFALGSAGANVALSAGTASVSVTTQSGCAWNASSNAAWLSTSASGTGSGSAGYSYGTNAGPARTGTLTIAGATFNVTQASGCMYALTASSASVSASGGSGTTVLSTSSSSCGWTISSSASWLTLTSAASGAGSATIGYSVAANTGAARSANLTIGGQTFLVSQAAASTTTPAPSSPGVASLNPVSMDFGSIFVGRSSSTKTAVLTNTGGGTLTVGSFATSGANPGDFQRGGTCTANLALAAGKYCTITVKFSPTDIGVRSASIAVSTSSGSVALSVTGTGKKSGKK
jgi:hypothetical protein